MAVVKTKSPAIKQGKAVVDAINYITKKEKTTADLTTYYGCTNSSSEVIANEFKMTREIFDKNKNVLSHHLIQSFSPDDNITPEKAHKIANEFVEKCLSNYQVVYATHTDGKNIHTHFIINSVSPLDGKKFYSNKRTVNLLRRASDELCYKNDLCVIEKNTNKYQRLDDATYRLALKGKSWKFELLNDLDVALKECTDKNSFISFFKENNYEIHYTAKTITFRKIGEQKGIRADTLAKQFGNKYTKKNIDKILKVRQPTEQKNKVSVSVPNKSSVAVKKSSPLPNIEYFEEQSKKEWKRYEKRYSNSIQIKNKLYLDKLIFSKDPFKFTLNLILYIFKRASFKTVHKNIINTTAPTTYKIREFTNEQKLQKTISNVPYKKLVNTVGNTAKIKLYSWQIAKLLNNGVLCYSKIDITKGTAIVTLKEHDLERVANLLGVTNIDTMVQQNKTIKNRSIYNKLKAQNIPIEYLVVNETQMLELDKRFIEYAKFQKGENKYNIAFSEKDKNKIINILYPKKSSTSSNLPTNDNLSFVDKNILINKRLKKEAEKTGEKLCYKVFYTSQYQVLKNSDIDCAVFRTNNGKYNVVFLEHNLSAINNIMNNGLSDTPTQPNNTKHSI